VDDPGDLVSPANVVQRLRVGGVGLLDGDRRGEPAVRHLRVAALDQDAPFTCVEQRLHGVGSDEAEAPQ